MGTMMMVLMVTPPRHVSDHIAGQAETVTWITGQWVSQWPPLFWY